VPSSPRAAAILQRRRSARWIAADVMRELRDPVQVARIRERGRR